ncbi:MAG: hypothetical protein ACI8PT_003943 [Gammaproteobacteria bacterium]|jgi:hypothetical protein
MAAQKTMEVIDALDVQQAQLDEQRYQLARQQAEVDRLCSRATPPWASVTLSERAVD